MYNALASAYDRFNCDYKELFGFIFSLLDREGVSDGVLCDLACGTASLSLLAQEAGYDVVSVDVSPDMLAVAREKSDALTLVCQDMRELDLFGTFRACVCTMDAINHITQPDELLEVFRRVALFCEPDGIFVFDINTEAKLEGLDGSAYTCEDEDFFVAWNVERVRDGLYEFCVDVFSLDSDGRYRRDTDVFCERAYPPESLCEMLKAVGFDIVGVYGDCVDAPPRDDEQRIFIAARRKKWQTPSE